jgi:hypothetical protein
METSGCITVDPPKISCATKNGDGGESATLLSKESQGVNGDRETGGQQRTWRPTRSEMTEGREADGRPAGGQDMWHREPRQESDWEPNTKVGLQRRYRVSSGTRAVSGEQKICSR